MILITPYGQLIEVKNNGIVLPIGGASIMANTTSTQESILINLN